MIRTVDMVELEVPLCDTRDINNIVSGDTDDRFIVYTLLFHNQ